LIYFDRDSKQRVIANVRKMICPEGMLVAGAAEGVGEMVGDLLRVESWLFRRPAAQGSAENARGGRL
jgi:chemotaxis methyl-accepting protein methylase